MTTRDRQLLRELPRGRQPCPRPDPYAADRLADLVDDLRRQRFLTGPIEEDGYQHWGPGRLYYRQSKVWASYGSSASTLVEIPPLSVDFPRLSDWLLHFAANWTHASRPVRKNAQRASRSCPKRFIALHLLAICWAIWEVARRLRGWLMEPTHFSPAALVAVLYAVRASSH